MRYRWILIVLVAGLCTPVFADDSAAWLNLADGSAPHLFEAETRSVSFDTKLGDHLRCLGEGWKEGSTGYLELREDGLWCTSLVSELHLNVVTPRPRELFLKLRPQLVDKLGPQIIEVFWGSTRLGVCAFDLARGWDFIDFVLPVPAAAQVAGLNMITLNARYAVSAASVGTGDDGTVYSYAIQQLMLREADGSMPPKSEDLRFGPEGMTQPPYSRVKLPFRVPRESAAHFHLDGCDAGAGARLRVLEERLDGVKEGVMDAAEIGEIDIAFVPESSEWVEIVFETGADPAVWKNPRVNTSSPPEPRLPYSVTGKMVTAQNVVLILCDAMARDHLGCYGATRSPSPVMDRMAREGVLFERAYSSASYTYSSTWSLVTGLFPFQHDAPETPLKVDERVPRLAGVLSAADIHTGVVSAQHWISPSYSTTEYFDEYLNAREPPKILEVAAEPELVTKQAADFVARNKENPFFLYLHYRPPHEPYYPPLAFKETVALDPAGVLDPKRGYMGSIKDGVRAMPREEERHMVARYAEMIRSIDVEIENVVDILAEHGLDDNTLVIITSDHGEAFMEHGWLSHGHTLYEEVVAIPMILWGADVASTFEASRIGAPVGNVGLFPTITEALGVDAPEGLAVPSYFSPGPVPMDQPLTMAQNNWRNRSHLWDPHDAYWWRRYKLIIDPIGAGVEVYDIHRDADERSDLAKLRPVLRDYLHANALAWRVEAQEKMVGPATMQEIKHTEDSLDALDALGYL